MRMPRPVTSSRAGKKEQREGCKLDASFLTGFYFSRGTGKQTLWGKFAFAPHLEHDTVGSLLRWYDSLSNPIRVSQQIWPLCISPQLHSVSGIFSSG